MKVYISGPITGNGNYIEEFEKGKQEVCNMFGDDVEIINPANLRHIMPESATWDEYMLLCCSLLDISDMIYMLPGWKTSAGACVEYGYAIAKGITSIINDERKGDLCGTES